MNNKKASLRKMMDERLSISEVKAICFDLDFIYDDLLGGSKKEKIITLLQLVDKKDLYLQLVFFLEKTNSTVDWPLIKQIPNNKKLNTRASLEELIIKIGGVEIYKSIKRWKP